MPDGMAQALADNDRYAEDGWLFTESRDLETLIGRKSTPMAEIVRAVLAG